MDWNFIGIMAAVAVAWRAAKLGYSRWIRPMLIEREQRYSRGEFWPDMTDAQVNRVVRESGRIAEQWVPRDPRIHAAMKESGRWTWVPAEGAWVRW